jgi:hypothetical protein
VVVALDRLEVDAGRGDDERPGVPELVDASHALHGDPLDVLRHVDAYSVAADGDDVDHLAGTVALCPLRVDPLVGEHGERDERHRCQQEQPERERADERTEPNHCGFIGMDNADLK